MWENQISVSFVGLASWSTDTSVLYCSDVNLLLIDYAMVGIVQYMVSLRTTLGLFTDLQE